jgi:hypothetical protein
VTRKLSPADTLRHAVSSIGNNLPVAFRIAWPWYAILMPVSLSLYFLLALATGGKPDANPGLDFSITLLVGAVAILAASSIAVNWHRYILRDEVPRGIKALRLDDVVWRYFGNMLLIMVSVMAVLIVIAMPLNLIAVFAQSPGLGLVSTLFVGVPIAGTLFLRLAIKLPAIALGRTDFSMRDAWQASEGNNLAILFVFILNILLALGVIGVVFAIHALLSLFGALIATAAEIMLELVANWILMIFGITILTSLYGFFVQHRDF